MKVWGSLARCQGTWVMAGLPPPVITLLTVLFHVLITPSWYHPFQQGFKYPRFNFYPLTYQVIKVFHDKTNDILVFSFNYCRHNVIWLYNKCQSILLLQANFLQQHVDVFVYIDVIKSQNYNKVHFMYKSGFIRHNNTIGICNILSSDVVIV